MVAVSVRDKEVFTKDPAELVEFVTNLKEGGDTQEYLLARKASAEAKAE